MSQTRKNAAVFMAVFVPVLGITVAALSLALHAGIFTGPLSAQAAAAYATHIISQTRVPQPISGYRSCCGPEMALDVLGAPDGRTGGFMNEGSTKGFVEVGFAQPIADGAGNDFSIRVTDSDESFTVKVKNAQGQVATIGSIAGVFPFGSAGGPTIEPAFDLGSVGYTSAVSVIVENANGTTEGSEGPDIDAFTVLNAAAVTPTPSVTPTVTPAPGATGSIGNFVWRDNNSNGIQDSGEPGVGSVAVDLRDCSDNYLATTSTNGSGLYGFSNLAAGCYKIKFHLPSGFTFSPRNASGSTDANDSDASETSGVSHPIDLSAGESDQTVDAGLIGSATPTPTPTPSATPSPTPSATPSPTPKPTATPIPTATPTPTPTTIPAPQCSDGIDNDGDGRVDSADAGCHTDFNPGNPASYGPNDNNENDEPQCADARDNDNDGWIDLSDPGCSSQFDDDESNDRDVRERDDDTFVTILLRNDFLNLIKIKNNNTNNNWNSNNNWNNNSNDSDNDVTVTTGDVHVETGDVHQTVTQNQ